MDEVYIVIERSKASGAHTIVAVYQQRPNAVRRMKQERAEDTYKSNTYMVMTYTIDDAEDQP